MVTKRLIPLILVTGLSYGCATFNSSDDFSVSGSIAQSIPIKTNQTVTIKCFCRNRTIKTNEIGNTLELSVTGTHSSVGYHGEQEKPEFIAEGLLRFVEKQTTGGLTLESREYTYIHHAYIIDQLEVVAPPDTEIHIRPILYDELEDRSVE